MISGLTKGEYWGIQAFMVKNSSLADITMSLMTLPHLYMRPGNFCQMFMTDGDATLSGKPIGLQAIYSNSTSPRFEYQTSRPNNITRAYKN